MVPVAGRVEEFGLLGRSAVRIMVLFPGGSMEI